MDRLRQLAQAGRRVVVLERRGVVGGACVSETIWPGFTVSRAAYVAGLLRPAGVRELGLSYRPLQESMNDFFQQMIDSGYLAR